MPSSANRRRPGWRLEDIPFGQIDMASVRNDEFLFVMLASASFVEILAETYSGNLIAHFDGDQDLTGWLESSWQKEEVQHGHALKTYVQTVWPEFDWETAHRAFCEEYSRLCTVEQLEKRPVLELVARCVVETGTSTFYRSLEDYTREPVLRQIIDNIKMDEVSHYTHFRRYFEIANADERQGVAAVAGAIWRRLREVRGEDAYIAFKHVYEGRYADRAGLEPEWRRYNRLMKRLARRHYPYLMAVRMLLKPLPMTEALKRLLQWPLLGLVRLLTLG
ncbi:MAG: ferritin-like protein [Herbaspirillum sp.]|jgi:hypothetical protein|nr:ferritin-like protein [Herbaspirillum sp.]